MIGSVRVAYHEAGHACAARRLNRKLERVSLSLAGGYVKEAGLSEDGSDEELERGLVVLLSGAAAERFAPEHEPVPRERNGGMSVSELEALADVEHRLASEPADEGLVAYCESRLGRERVEKARRLADEFAARSAATGDLETLADALLLHGTLSGEEVEGILAAARA